MRANEASLRLLAAPGLRPFAVLPAQFRGQPCLEAALGSATAAAGWAWRCARRAPPTRLRWPRCCSVSRRVLMPFVPSPRPRADLERWLHDELLPAGGVTVAEHAGRVVGVLAVRSGQRGALDRPALRAPGAGRRRRGRGAAGARLAGCWPARRGRCGCTPSRPTPMRAPSTSATVFVAVAFGDGSDNEERCPDVLYEHPGAADMNRGRRPLVFRPGWPPAARCHRGPNPLLLAWPLASGSGPPAVAAQPAGPAAAAPAVPPGDLPPPSRASSAAPGWPRWPTSTGPASRA